MKIAYLGPEGTFTQQAACLAADDYISLEIANGGELSFIPLPTIEEIFSSVANDKTNFGVVPIENSIEGTVNATLDTLVFDFDLFICKQFSMPIIQNLLVRKEFKTLDRKELTSILSHPQALAQSRKFLNANYPNAEIVNVSSTSEASKIIAKDSQCLTRASVGSNICAELYGLVILHEGIQENASNTTHFIMLSKTNTSEPKDGCKTTIAFSTENRPGELHRIMNIFSLYDLNLSKITSRPTKHNTGEYIFFVDIDGYGDINDVSSALSMVKRKTRFFKNLGSYPCKTLL